MVTSAVKQSLKAYHPVVEPLTPLRRYYGDSRIRTERVLRANYLATINDLPKSVEKTADKTMKVIYTLRRGG